MKRRNFRNMIILGTTILFFSCEKTKTPVVEKQVIPTLQVSNIEADPATNGNRFAFFSLERNEKVANTDSATTKWDIGFRGTTIITNAGTSGPGLGGAFVQTAANYDTYTTIPADSIFKTDAAPIFAITSGSGKGWYSYNPTANLITPIAGRILSIKTATGKYAKVEILSYYKNAPVTPTAADPTRFYTFRFAYQPNGTKVF